MNRKNVNASRGITDAARGPAMVRNITQTKVCFAG